MHLASLLQLVWLSPGRPAEQFAPQAQGPTTKGTGIVPGRSPVSWPPPNTRDRKGGLENPRRRAISVPTPTGP